MAGKMIKVLVKGSFDNIERLLKRASKKNYIATLHKYGEAGVVALAKGTPIDSGETALSWSYYIEEIKDGYRIVWTNSNINDGAVVAILLQYGHATGTGGYVQGTDYINPAMYNIFEELAEQAWKEVVG